MLLQPMIWIGEEWGKGAAVVGFRINPNGVNAALLHDEIDSLGFPLGAGHKEDAIAPLTAKGDRPPSTY